MKLMKNRIVIGVLCIITGLLVAFVALPALQRGGQYTNTNAVSMAKSVDSGTQITAEMVETVKLPQNLVQGGISEASLVVGKYANTTLYVGDFLTKEKYTASPELDALAAGTVKGKAVVSVILPSLAAGVSGRLLPGDIVTVMVLPKSQVNQVIGVEPEAVNELPTGAMVYPELQYIEVCMVVTNDGSDASVSPQPDKEIKNNLPVTVSFYANQEQSLKLAELENQGAIHLAFVARGSAAGGYIPDAQRVLSTEVH